MFPTGSHNWTYLQLMAFFGPRVFFSILCGGIVGMERELKHKPAGIKTNILICLGAALYTSTSILMSESLSETGHYGDPARVAAQIVSGIGFLGGGTIIQARGTITGLTTAATIWVVAAIGICIGMGHSDIAFAASTVVVFTLVATSWFEDRILGRSLTFACEILVEDPQGQVRMSINEALVNNNLNLDDFDITTQNGQSLLKCRYSGHRKDNKKFVLELWSIPGIREVKQL
ncbi:MAG: MgtC/SapB family protein [Bdellovibrionia bacterium]